MSNAKQKSRVTVMTWRAMVVAVSVVALVHSAAGAQESLPGEVIGRFYAAVGSTDLAEREAAALAAIKAARTHRDDPKADMLAFEAGFLLCRSNACQKADDAVGFLKSRTGASVPAVEVQGLAALVARAKKDTKASRKELAAAADALLGAEPSLLSIRLSFDRLADLIDEGDFAVTAEFATRAANALEGVPSVEPFWWDLRIAALSAGFNDVGGLSDYEQALAMEREIENARIRNGWDEAHWSAPRYWTLSALSLATEAWLTSSNKLNERSQRQIRDRVDSAEPLLPRPQIVAADDGLPSCEFGVSKGPQVVYPRSDARLGRVGAVLIRFSMENGRVVSPEVLAAIPEASFATASLAAMDDVRFERTGNEPEGSCQFRRDDIVYPIIFQLGERAR